MAMKGNRGSRRRSARIDILPDRKGYRDATAAEESGAHKAWMLLRMCYRRGQNASHDLNKEVPWLKIKKYKCDFKFYRQKFDILPFFASLFKC
jgi:hypothetical protein